MKKKITVFLTGAALFFTGAAFGATPFCSSGGSDPGLPEYGQTTSHLSCPKARTASFAVPLFINGRKAEIRQAFIKDGRTYVSLRELCEAANIAVEWVDPGHHSLPIPGGNLPGGINLTNPTFVYTAEVTDFANTANTIKAVEITGLWQKYRDDKKRAYSFSDEGLVLRSKGKETIVPLKYNPSNGRMYLAAEEFRIKVQPHLTDLCMQP